MRHLQLGWDLPIETEVVIPGAPTLIPEQVSTPPVRVVYGCSHLANVRRRDGPYAAAADALQFAAPGVAEYLVRADGVTIAPDPAGPDEDAIAGLLIATALPALLWMRGDIVLHAAAVRSREGQVVAILGPSGAGKSSAVHAFVTAGAQVIADDSIRIAGDGPARRISGLPGGYFQSAGPNTAERILTVVPRERQLSAASLDLIVELAAEADRRFAPVIPSVALARLLRHRHRPRVPRILEREPVTLARLAEIAAHVPFRRWPAAERGNPDMSALVQAVAGG